MKGLTEYNKLHNRGWRGVCCCASWWLGTGTTKRVTQYHTFSSESK